MSECEREMKRGVVDSRGNNIWSLRVETMRGSTYLCLNLKRIIILLI